ncbi:MAG: hypothetical protein ACK5YI_06330 [Rhodospirillales bacterium]|jgi:hypothetical protein
MTTETAPSAPAPAPAPSAVTAKPPIHKPAIVLSAAFALAAPAPLIADTLPLEVAIAAKLVTLAYAGFLAYLAFAPRRMAARG